MKAWLKRIDLDTFTSSLLELPDGAHSLNVGRTAELRDAVIAALMTTQFRAGDLSVETS